MEGRFLRIILEPRRRRLRPEWEILHDEEVCVTCYYSIVKLGRFSTGLKCSSNWDDRNAYKIKKLKAISVTVHEGP
jgi:hypothetical protein